MVYFRLKHCPLIVIFALGLLLFTACGSDNTTATPLKTPVTVVSTAEVVTATSGTATPGDGPIIILTPTPVSNGGASSQQAILTDRTLIVNSVSKTAGTDGNTSAIVLSLTLKNTGSSAFTNASTYFSLLNSDGSVFMPTASIQGNFYGTINAGSSSSGSLTFQVPTQATSSLKLFYNPGSANDAVFLPLPV